VVLQREIWSEEVKSSLVLFIAISLSEHVFFPAITMTDEISVLKDHYICSSDGMIASAEINHLCFPLCDVRPESLSLPPNK